MWFFRVKEIKWCIALLVACLAGCEKKPEPISCYECVMTYANGVSAGIQFPCSYQIEQWQKEQTDNNGQPLQSDCKKK